MNKVVVVGCGNVGMAYAYALINQNVNIEELILIDIDNKKALGNAMDLCHALLYSNSNIKVKAGTYKDCYDANIVVITAGVNQKKNETRLQLLNKNCSIIKDITLNVISSGFDGIFLVATNPVDIMTYVVRKYSKFQSNKIIGSGTILDTSRLSFLLSSKLKVNCNDINAYFLAEHGDSGFACFSSAKVGAISITDLLPMEELIEIENKVKNLAYKVIDLKGETSFGIGVCLVRITNAIINDENKVLPVSAPYEGIYLGMPTVINKDGIKGVMKIKLSSSEKEKLKKSKDILKQIIKDLEE